ncbi:MAG TPA: phosphatase [Bacteroidia bacterium]|nr:phosphatase [Bacteroidia bacterium]
MNDVLLKFTAAGGSLICPAEDMRRRHSAVKAYMFDWDGVFNNGQKVAGSGSPFSEVDSMGTNLLRFSHYLKHQSMPVCAVISGEKNDTALAFAERECFQYSFFKTPHKIEALRFICDKQGLIPEQVAYVFDDVLDLSVAQHCGLRILVRHGSNILFEHYCRENRLADYITANDGDHYAVRESSELLIGLNGNFEEVILNRSLYSKEYDDYIQHRRAIKTQTYSVREGKVEALSPY